MKENTCSIVREPTPFVIFFSFSGNGRRLSVFLYLICTVLDTDESSLGYFVRTIEEKATAGLHR